MGQLVCLGHPGAARLPVGEARRLEPIVPLAQFDQLRAAVPRFGGAKRRGARGRAGGCSEHLLDLGFGHRLFDNGYCESCVLSQRHLEHQMPFLNKQYRETRERIVYFHNRSTSSKSIFHSRLNIEVGTSAFLLPPVPVPAACMTMPFRAVANLRFCLDTRHTVLNLDADVRSAGMPRNADTELRQFSNTQKRKNLAER